MAELTPMMQQYIQMKEDHPDCLLFFRLGDFYEMFQDDAKIGARELGLTLTTRDRGKPEEEQTPMCGVPYHSAQSYIARLIKRGYKVAICEQMEDPKQATGLVERGIVRIVTPGTAMGDEMLDERRSNYICAILRAENGAGLAWCELSTGHFTAVPFLGDSWLTHLRNQLSACPPSEALFSPDAARNKELVAFLQERLGCLCQDGGDQRFEEDAALKALSGCGLWSGGAALPEDMGPGQRLCYLAAGGLAAYLAETQRTDLSHLGPLVLDQAGRAGAMEMDLAVRRSLELTETLRGENRKGSLIWVLDKTCTPMGHRLINAWLKQPLRSPAAILRRQEAVAALAGNTVTREELILRLREVPDLERLITRVSFGSANARDMRKISQGLAALPALAEQATAAGRSLRGISRDLSGLEQLQQEIDRVIRDEDREEGAGRSGTLPFSIREGGMIRPGYDPQLDQLWDTWQNGDQRLTAIEQRERERTGIKNLKVRFNKVFGYYIEVSRNSAKQVPADYVRKQTLVNNERYITQELKDLEHDVLSAKDRIGELEFQIFNRLRERVMEQVRPVQRAAESVAELDVFCSFAAAAVENHYCRPLVDDSDLIEITEGRHPVVEKTLQGERFVPNDTHMNGGDERLCIITGPNMAGKSTYMRQVALIVLMAQMGSFVPAKSAHIGAVDRVFTRIGASDDLTAGQSTFMVEMTEVANMLENATNRSLLILDEIGRGTSTYDGMAIAQAVLEYCADKKRLGARTLFATHYHELTAVEQSLQGVKNYHIAVKKRQDGIVFLRKIVPGGADRSYGVEVARLAGVPPQVITRARQLLRELERQDAGAREAPAPSAPEEGQVSLEDMAGAEVLDRLRGLSVETITPVEAMNVLYALKQKL